MDINDTPYDAVVSVLMLREGWDVKNIGVICLFRKFTKIFIEENIVDEVRNKLFYKKPSLLRKEKEKELLRTRSRQGYPKKTIRK